MVDLEKAQKERQREREGVQVSRRLDCGLGAPCARGVRACTLQAPKKKKKKMKMKKKKRKNKKNNKKNKKKNRERERDSARLWTCM